MSNQPTNNDQALVDACRQFQTLAEPAIQFYKTDPLAFSRSANQLTYTLGTGGITYRAKFSDFIEFIEGFYSPESLQSHKISQGLMLAVQGTAIEKRKVSVRHSDLDLNTVLEQNINKDVPDIRTVCAAIKQALEESKILSQLDHHAGLTPAHTSSKPTRQSPSTRIVLPSPTARTIEPPPNQEFILKLANSKTAIGGIHDAERTALITHKIDLEAASKTLTRYLNHPDAHPTIGYIDEMIAAIKVLMFDNNNPHVTNFLLSPPNRIIAEMDAVITSVKPKILASCQSNAETATVELGFNLVDDILPNVKKALRDGYDRMAQLNQHQSSLHSP